ncbi:MAG: ABC transporter ATP-binding protein [bacterium]|nr:ABC transporter ATP-binding protein [bacterium]MDT8365682.1 ABC transporter ATP-binding protein [bacterium]
MRVEEKPVIDVYDLKKSFGGKPAVKGISLKVGRGEIFGFLGPNGSGKTTTIRMLCGLMKPDGGHGSCLGFDVLTEMSKIKENAGYMTQNFSLYEDMTVGENLDFMARLYGIPNRKDVVAENLSQLGMTGNKDQLAGTLSGGWKQRLALGACMIHNPQLLLLDEPTAGVDPKARFDFWNKIHKLSAEGVTILVSTHYMDEAEQCHKLGYIVAGELLTEGSPEEVIKKSGLVTWRVAGPDIWLLSEKISGLPAVAQVTVCGTELHVSGYDEEALHRDLKPFMDGKWAFEVSKPGVDDVFVSLMKQRGDEGL